MKDWVRPPVVSFNQAGYTPGRSKVALIETDPHGTAPGEAELVRLAADGTRQSVLRSAVIPRGRWMRYNYAAFDFSQIREPGIYAIAYGGQVTNPFRIAADAYDRIWQTSLDTFIAEQMDHVGIREQYRVWSRPPTSTTRARPRPTMSISMVTRWARTSTRRSSPASISPA